MTSSLILSEDEVFQYDQRNEYDNRRRTGERSRYGKPPLRVFVAALALVLISITFLFTMLMFRDVFQEATAVIAALSSLFTVVGTVLGTYFGIKVSSGTIDKTRGAIERANDTAYKALAALPPEEGKRITGQPPGSTSGPPSGPTVERPAGQQPPG